MFCGIQSPIRHPVSNKALAEQLFLRYYLCRLELIEVDLQKWESFSIGELLPAYKASRNGIEI
jgi:hypothetical protein